MDSFTFTFKVGGPPPAPPPPKSPGTAFPTFSSVFPSSPSPLRPIPAGPSTSKGHAASQARYREKNADNERAKARERMRKKRDNQEAIAEGRSLHLQNLSSEELRRSKTFAAFREYVRRYMLWVVFDSNNEEDVAGYDRFCQNGTRPMDDESLEFLFRHVDPHPESIEDVDDGAEYETLHSMSTPNTAATQHAQSLETAEKEAKRLRARERMARRRANIKALPPHLQEAILARARASRARYREQHRTLLMQKERSRRQEKSTYSPDEYLRRRRIRENRPSYLNYQRTAAPNAYQTATTITCHLSWRVRPFRGETQLASNGLESVLVEGSRRSIWRVKIATQRTLCKLRLAADVAIPQKKKGNLKAEVEGRRETQPIEAVVHLAQVVPVGVIHLNALLDLEP
ncbi:hypothetical protein DFH06DRAFT_1149473 [Mycena polygramma]|nr:hypothetical protein DFH06DRAFT_1149473 [Mycena polygramma]